MGVSQKYEKENRKKTSFFPTKPRHNLEQESPPASLVDSISPSLCAPFIFLPSFIALLSNNESVSLKRGNNKALIITRLLAATMGIIAAWQTALCLQCVESQTDTQTLRHSQKRQIFISPNTLRPFYSSLR